MKQGDKVRMKGVPENDPEYDVGEVRVVGVRSGGAAFVEVKWEKADEVYSETPNDLEIVPTRLDLAKLSAAELSELAARSLEAEGGLITGARITSVEIAEGGVRIWSRRGKDHSATQMKLSDDGARLVLDVARSIDLCSSLDLAKRARARGRK